MIVAIAIPFEVKKGDCTYCPLKVKKDAVDLGYAASSLFFFLVKMISAVGSGYALLSCCYVLSAPTATANVQDLLSKL